MTFSTSGLISFFKKIFKENTRVKEFKNDIITAFIDWIEPWFLEEESDLFKKIMNPPYSNDTQEKIREVLEKLKTNENFVSQLKIFLNDPKLEQLNEKNIFEGDIDEIEGNIHLGDKSSSLKESFSKKNIFKGSIKKIQGNLRIGDD